MSQNINKIIKSKLKKRLRLRIFRQLLSWVNLSVKNLIVWGVPTAALFFTTFLAWQVNNFNYTPLKLAKANGLESSVLGVSSSGISSNSNNNLTEKNLDIPFIRQIYPLSCEAASLEMALKYYKIDVSQDKLLEQIGTSEPLKLTQKDDNYYWGDPNFGFVGDPKGWFTGAKNGETSLKYATGWGVFNGPILKVAKTYRPNSYLVNNGTVDQIKTALDKNNPVIWWHRRDDIHQEKLQIITNTGSKIDYEQMHVAVVTGYYQKDGVTFYKINDPFFNPYDISEADFIRYWARHDGQMVVVA